MPVAVTLPGCDFGFFRVLGVGVQSTSREEIQPKKGFNFKRIP